MQKLSHERRETGQSPSPSNHSDIKQKLHAIYPVDQDRVPSRLSGTDQTWHTPHRTPPHCSLDGAHTSVRIVKSEVLCRAKRIAGSLQGRPWIVTPRNEKQLEEGKLKGKEAEERHEERRLKSGLRRQVCTHATLLAAANRVSQRK